MSENPFYLSRNLPYDFPAYKDGSLNIFRNLLYLLFHKVSPNEIILWAVRIVLQNLKFYQILGPELIL